MPPTIKTKVKEWGAPVDTLERWAVNKRGGEHQRGREERRRFGTHGGSVGWLLREISGTGAGGRGAPSLLTLHWTLGEKVAATSRNSGRGEGLS